MEAIELGPPPLHLVQSQSEIDVNRAMGTTSDPTSGVTTGATTGTTMGDTDVTIRSVPSLNNVRGISS